MGEGDEGGKGTDERRCGYLRMRMIQRWTWSSWGGGGEREGEWAYCLEEEGVWVACIMI